MYRPSRNKNFVDLFLFVVSFTLWNKVMIHRPKIININRNGNCLKSAIPLHFLKCQAHLRFRDIHTKQYQSVF